MSFPTTAPITELQAVNRILASVGQAPVTALDTTNILVVTKKATFSGFISTTTLTTTNTTLKPGYFIKGEGVADNTYIVAGPVVSGADRTYTVTPSQTVGATDARVRMEGFEQDVTTQMQTNPDVALAYDTLQQVSREVQAEGWTFNKEYNYKQSLNNSNEVEIPNNVLYMDLSQNTLVSRNHDSVRKNGKLYDRIGHTFSWKGHDPLQVDVVWLYDWGDIPPVIQEYIISRSAAFLSQRLIGDGNQYQTLQQQEIYTRAMAMEYETQQGDYTFFGHPQGSNYYVSYQPFHALYR
jgi:hypothetical protein